MNRLPVKALYLHVPFCARKCYYCDFNTYVAKPEVWERFVQALVREIRALGRLYPDTVLETVYAGGGTPSLLSCRQWQQIFEALRGSFHLASDAEISLEANPGTVDCEKLQVLRELGVNRLSIGAQSFNRELLRKLGRSHGPEAIVHSVELARSVGGFSLNLDLMFGIPGQTMEDWRQSLAAAVELGPDHLSAYGLKVEEGTPYSRWYDQGVLDLPSEDLEAKMYTALMEFMDKTGYEQYEISNFARPGARCRHNLVYWNNEPYLAVGPGAHGYVDGVRYVVVRNVPVYMELAWEGSSTVEERHEVSDEEEMEDTMILGLRLLEGVGDDRFAQRHGRSLFDVFSEPVERYLRSGLLVQEGSRVRLAREALWISNEVLQSFLALSIDKV
ncbi:radical SAM family heme chaperone HemW [Kyrpidia tusciae]|uniref:Heme chaperone HemW n=1 Tax=Kyrpidia tusciae (strain DSM 2912 / NBRC 15312 / T2) TaxID=562970 RepID=D5WXN0_KYRT2|nr:radical SAM family heme chaperone HemW [Kyrpidia tusciae]ADG05951.1 oxygen-independent coproporphyrinogen III oxidase [Kyrpidia tusciae DSM 2912]